MKKVFVKFSFIIVGLVIGLGIVEILLRLFISYKIAPHQFVLHDTYNGKIAQTYTGYYQDSIYELLKSRKGEKSPLILAWGDSFTNGGNLEIGKVYPSELYRILNKDVSVLNLGICEDTTLGVYSRLKSFLSKSASNVPKKRIAIFLVGAADYFNLGKTFSAEINDEFSLEQISGPIVERHYWSSLKVIRLFQYVVQEVLLANTKDLKLFNQVFPVSVTYGKKLTDNLVSCFSMKEQMKKECYRTSEQKMRKYIETRFKDHGQAQIDETLYKAFIFAMKREIENDEQRVKEMLYAAEQFPSLLADDDFRTDLLNTYYLGKRSLISPEMLLAELKEIYKKYTTLKGENEKLRKILNVIEMKNTNVSAIANNAYKIWGKIIKLTKENGIYPLMLTYPRDLYGANKTLRKVASDYNVDMIDIEKTFAKIDDSVPLVADDSHATDRGYELMALTIANYLKEKEILK